MRRATFRGSEWGAPSQASLRLRSGAYSPIIGPQPTPMPSIGRAITGSTALLASLSRVHHNDQASPDVPTLPAMALSDSSSSGTTLTALPTCSAEQEQASDALWKSAAATDACTQYALRLLGSISIFWPCKATGCTAEMANLADKLPDCVYSGENTSEKASVTNAVNDCRGIRTPSPTTATPEPTTTQPTNLCTGEEVTETIRLTEATAASDECKTYAKVLSSSVLFEKVPCSSECYSRGFLALNASLPDCYDPFQSTSFAKMFGHQLERCIPTVGEEATGINLSVTYSYNGTAEVEKSKSTAAPASTVPTTKSEVMQPSGVTSHCITILASVALAVGASL